MNSPLANTCCARLPAAALPCLGRLRHRADLRVLARGEELWLFWPAPDADLAQLILALPGADLLGLRDGLHHRPGLSLPVFDVPDASVARPLSAVLFPAPIVPEPPGPPTWQPVPLVLVRDATPRPTTALRLPLAELARWAEDATSFQIEGLQAACRAGVALLRGRLPALPGERFHGERVLIPAGYRPEPALGEEVLHHALHLLAQEIALLGEGTAEVIPRSAFGPLSRASLRKLQEERPA